MIFFSNHARRWSRMGRLEHSNTGTTRKTLETTETAYHPRLYLYRSKISKIYFHQQRPSRGSQPASQRLVRDSTGVYLPRRRWPYGERRIGVVVEHITARAEWNANSQTPAAALPSPVHQGCKSTHRGLAQEHAKERDVGVKGFCRPVLHALTLRFCFHFIFRLFLRAVTPPTLKIRAPGSRGSSFTGLLGRIPPTWRVSRGGGGGQRLTAKLSCFFARTNALINCPWLHGWKNQATCVW